MTSFSFVWGSLDPYSTLSATDVNGHPIFFGPLGTQLDGASVADYLGLAIHSTNAINLQFASIEHAAVITIATTDNAFEVDGLSWTYYTPPASHAVRALLTVPEPAPIVMLAGGAGALVAAGRRRR